MGRKIMKTKLVHNVETGEVSEVELTAEEIAQLEADIEIANAEKVELQAQEALKESRRQKLLALGLTEEELNA